ncbi:MAG: hypothetical protein ABIK09_07805 [Pseudomonadota bacterium]
MSEAQKKYECPHCGTELLAFELPEAGGWDEPYHLACFNDECSYYKNGWDWMMSQYEVRTSYRYRVNPGSGVASPIAVWSKTALRDRIVKKNNTPPQ